MSSSSALELGAPAKLNLFLEVLGRRDDGYHEIDSVMAEIDLADRIRIEKAEEISLRVEGTEGGGAPEDETNLVWRAAEALGVGAAITLEKRIPAGAGLGGGSSDAAAVLLGLDALYDLDLPEERLFEAARALGADVPFFLQGGLCRCRGIGDELDPVENPPEKRFLVIVPGLKMSTERVYGAFPGLTGNPEIASVFLEQYCGGPDPDAVPYFNRLQATAERLEPGLAEFRRGAEDQYGLAFTMSGSGSSYFAELGEEFREAKDQLARAPGPGRVFVAKTDSSKHQT